MLPALISVHTCYPKEYTQISSGQHRQVCPLVAEILFYHCVSSTRTSREVNENCKRDMPSRRK